jgi:glycosyltransferase involved in cell wall biosynthesis
MHPQPLVSIGVPVFNGDAHLPRTLDSILAQTYQNFEVIISDNASTDATADICAEYAARDPRIRCHRQTKNIGAPENWNFVARAARGHYFKWSSASDRCEPRFLEACVAVLEDDPSVALCFGRTSYVDENDIPVVLPDTDVEVLDESPYVRFRRVCEHLMMNNEQYGVIRRETLMRTRLDRPYPHGDLVLMAELALLGKFKRLSEPLLIRRVGEREWTGTMSNATFGALFWPDAPPRRRADFTRRQLDYLRVAICCPMPLTERLHAVRYALRMAYWRRRELSCELVGLFGKDHTACPSDPAQSG